MFPIYSSWLHGSHIPIWVHVSTWVAYFSWGSFPHFPIFFHIPTWATYFSMFCPWFPEPLITNVATLILYYLFPPVINILKRIRFQNIFFKNRFPHTSSLHISRSPSTRSRLLTSHIWKGTKHIVKIRFVVTIRIFR